jgi:hypothetical protein
MSRSIYGKINGLIYSFVNENKCNPDIIIMSPRTREDFRNEFYGRLGMNSGSEIISSAHCGYKLKIIESTDIADGEFMLATNFKK